MVDPHEVEGHEGDEPDYHPEELEGHEGEMELFIVPPNPPRARQVRQKIACIRGKKPASTGSAQQQPTGSAQQQPGSAQEQSTGSAQQQPTGSSI